MKAFAHGIIEKPKDWREDQEQDLARFYVETVQSNIEFFLKDRPHHVVHLEDGGETFNEFLHLVGAEGNLEAARSTWLRVHNAR
jgi:DNA primase